MVKFVRLLNKLWETVAKSTIITRLIEAIKLLYKGSSSKIKIGNLSTKGSKVTMGLRQDCSLLPTLFKIYLERVLQIGKGNANQWGYQFKTHMYIHSVLQMTR